MYGFTGWSSDCGGEASLEVVAALNVAAGEDAAAAAGAGSLQL